MQSHALEMEFRAWLWDSATWLCILAASLFMAMSALDQHLKRRDLPPGPRGWPIFGNMFQMAGSMPHRLFLELGKVYGPIVFLKVGSIPMVVINSAEMAKQVLKVQDVEFANRPPSIFAEYFSHGYQDLGFRDYGDKWKLMRRVCTGALFSRAGLKSTEDIRKEEVGSMVRSVLEAIKQGNLVDMSKLFHECSMNLMCRIFFSKKFYEQGVQVSPEMEAFHQLIQELTLESGKFNIGDAFPVLRRFDLQGREQSLGSLFPKLRKFLFSMVEEHKSAAKTERVDFTHSLLSLKYEDELSDMEQVALLSDLLIGGLDTTYSTLDYAMAELLRHPECMHKAVDELDRVVGRDRAVQESDLPSLQYLQDIVKEIFRLHPAAPTGVPHHNLHETRLGKYRIPAKSTILINFFGIGRDPATWADPEVFNPERFTGSHINPLGHSFELLPFSSGRRGCVGLSLAMLVIPTALATLLHAFEWAAAPPGCEIGVDNETVGLVCFREEPLTLRATPRLPDCVYG